jgi:LmbE family N-acetylglucosaminyl deacetylase
MSDSPQSSGRRVAAVVAHPDDEVLGCGGALRRHALAGDEIWVIILADGETSRDLTDQANHTAAIAQREAAARVAANILGIRHVTFQRFPDNRLDTLALLEITKVVERYLRECKPDTIYTHHAGDLNIDHRLVHQAVATACRPQPDNAVEALLFFETASSTEWQPLGSGPAFSPNWFVDISATLEAKMRALRAYDRELKAWPHSRSIQGIEHLARWRGATVGCEAAEAFMLGRQIRR